MGHAAHAHSFEVQPLLLSLHLLLQTSSRPPVSLIDHSSELSLLKLCSASGYAPAIGSLPTRLRHTGSFTLPNSLPNSQFPVPLHARVA